MKTPLGYLLIPLMCCAAAVDATTWHVSPDPLSSIPEPQRLPSISSVTDRVQPGDTVVIHTGIYRETVVFDRGGRPDRPVRVMAAEGAHVIVTGADRISDWKSVTDRPGVFYTHWPHRFITWGRDHTHAGALPVGRAEQVLVEGYALLQAQHTAQLTPGTFTVDMDAQQLTICPVANSVGYEPVQMEHLRVEASVRSAIWVVNAPHIHTKGLIFRYAANHAQEGAVQVKAPHVRFEDCQFERVNGVGLRVEAPEARIYRCTFRDNGYGAFEAVRAHGLRLVGCLIMQNNMKGFDRGWGAVNKIVLSRNVLVDQCRFLRNRGFGLWFDIGNERCTVSRSLFAENEQAGLFYEISISLYAHDNVFIKNGWDAGYGSWGATAGLVLSSSERCRVERNLFFGNHEGLAFREQRRTTPTVISDRERPVWNRDHRIERNLFVANGVHVWGWFAQGDARHWPDSWQTTAPAPINQSGDMAHRYLAVDAEGHPTRARLPDLRLAVDHNLYTALPGGVMWGWGPQWDDHKTYNSLALLRTHLGFEQSGFIVDAVFVDSWNADFRLPDRHPAIRQGCYPARSVPGVRLTERPVR